MTVLEVNIVMLETWRPHNMCTEWTTLGALSMALQVKAKHAIVRSCTQLYAVFGI
jgi:hypothetical protein